MIMDIPFDLTNKLLMKAVQEYGVIFCPVSFFCLNPKTGRNQIRLAFSNITEQDIKEGIRRLARFIRDTHSQLRGALKS